MPAIQNLRDLDYFIPLVLSPNGFLMGIFCTELAGPNFELKSFVT